MTGVKVMEPTKIVYASQPSELSGVEMLYLVSDQPVSQMSTNRILKKTENGCIVQSYEFQKAQHCGETEMRWLATRTAEASGVVHAHVRIGKI